MNIDETLAGVWTFASYSLGFCLRYFLLAGGLYWVLHRAYKQFWLPYRVQPGFPSREQVEYEIRWSFLNAACSGISTVVTFYLVRGGHTSMYFSVAEHGWTWFVATIVLCLVGYDTWIYWQHRMMHTPLLYRHIHYVHHKVGNPTPFATFAQHPVETFAGNLFFILVIVYVPVHVMAVTVAGAYMFVYGIIGHLGYELFPAWLTRNALFRWFNTATYHNMHHSELGCNYGAWFLYWDRWMGTAHPDYEPKLAAIHHRLRATSRVAVPSDARSSAI